MMSPQAQLPVERDFDPFNGCLDAQSAWKHFGGLDLEAAKAKFAENPLCYQEDFMFMGGRAFAYYFPVIDEHLKSVPDEVHDDDHEAWILAACIEMQFNCFAARVQHLAPRVVELAKYVLENMRRFRPYGSELEGQRVVTAWTDLIQLVEADRKSR